MGSRKRMKKVLFIKYRAMGDSIIGLGAISYFKELYPNTKVHYGIPSWIAPLYQELKSPSDLVCPLDLRSLKGRWNFIKLLLKNRYDLIYEFHQTSSNKILIGFITKLFGIKYFYHNHNIKKQNTGVVNQGVRSPSIQRDLDGLWTALKKIEKKEISYPSYLSYPPKLVFLKESVVRKKNKIILGIVSNRESKVWPIEYFSKLVEMITLTNPDLSFVIPVSKNYLDQKLKAELLDFCSVMGIAAKIEFLETSLDKLPSYIFGARLYIGNDTGLKHLCVALSVNTVTLFGPEEPLEWHPYDQKKHRYLFLENMPCRTKTSHFCGIDYCDNHLCLNQILPQDVMAVCRDLL